MSKGIFSSDIFFVKANKKLIKKCSDVLLSRSWLSELNTLHEFSREFRYILLKLSSYGKFHPKMIRIKDLGRGVSLMIIPNNILHSSWCNYHRNLCCLCGLKLETPCCFYTKNKWIKRKSYPFFPLFFSFSVSFIYNLIFM